MLKYRIIFSAILLVLLPIAASFEDLPYDMKITVIDYAIHSSNMCISYPTLKSLFVLNHSTYEVTKKYFFDEHSTIIEKIAAQKKQLIGDVVSSIGTQQAAKWLIDTNLKNICCYRALNNIFTLKKINIHRAPPLARTKTAQEKESISEMLNRKKLPFRRKVKEFLASQFCKEEDIRKIRDE